ncbi:hypothetical protein WOLCODRAFT_149610 [Wolfiporia cocos MD-104 SS10]|uniref:Uncharacterized protein n=1 Tax=Wolfiporia cocos (strain MD-104) TaxID=742152 RepID=A0A2H3J9R2_WOLCO|nr:hypothetical protein WOLCODRAFT_149610 [Wolfiporia cocos MD-104 SS10]
MLLFHPTQRVPVPTFPIQTVMDIDMGTSALELEAGNVGTAACFTPACPGFAPPPASQSYSEEGVEGTGSAAPFCDDDELKARLTAKGQDTYDIVISHLGMGKELLHIKPVPISAYSSLNGVFGMADLEAESTRGPVLEMVEQILYEDPRQNGFIPTLLHTFEIGSDIGVYLAHQEHFKSLNEAKCHIQPSLGSSLKASIRVKWPGYTNGKTRQINVRGSTAAMNSITVGKLVSEIAKAMDKISQEYETETCSEGRWRIGPKNITLQHLVLHHVIQVSSNSFQPVLYVCRT